MEQVNMDFVGMNGGSGEMANMLLNDGRIDIGQMRPFIAMSGPLKGKPCISVFNGGDPAKPESYETRPITANATLRRNEWIQLDEALLATARIRLNGIQDLIDNNLTFNLGNGMGTTVLEYHTVSDAMEAALTMDGVTRSQGDRPNYETGYLPLPIIHVDFEINSRVLAASRNLGNPLDTTSIELAGRKVAEQLETMLFTNTTYVYGGGTIYSYMNEPNRNTGSLVGNWDASARTGAEIVDDVLAMKQASINARHYGPFQLYIPTAYETVLDGDYDATTPGTTIRERILKIAGINGIKVVDTLTANNVLLVQMTTDVVRLVRGLGLQNVQWSTEGNMVTKYKVLTIQVPQVRSDQGGYSGVTHFS